MLSTSIGNVGMLIVNEARRSEAEAEAEAWTLEAEAEAEAEATISGLKAEARPRGLTSLLSIERILKPGKWACSWAVPHFFNCSISCVSSSNPI